MITADTIAKVVEKDTSASSNWKISLKQLELNNNGFAYDNRNSVPTASGTDFNHLLLRNINLNGKDIAVTPEKISLTLNDLSLHEERGFSLKTFSTKLTYTKTQLELAHLNIETAYSKVGDYIGIRFKSLRSLKDSIGFLQTTVNLQNTFISLKDIALFKPDLFAN